MLYKFKEKCPQTTAKKPAVKLTQTVERKLPMRNGDGVKINSFINWIWSSHPYALVSHLNWGVTEFYKGRTAHTCHVRWRKCAWWNFLKPYWTLVVSKVVWCDTQVIQKWTYDTLPVIIIVFIIILLLSSIPRPKYDKFIQYNNFIPPRIFSDILQLIWNPTLKDSLDSQTSI